MKLKTKIKRVLKWCLCRYREALFKIRLREFDKDFNYTKFQLEDLPNLDVISIYRKKCQLDYNVQIFSLFGKSIDVYNFDSINWNLDFVNNYEWQSGLFYPEYVFSHDCGRDIKVPWELARMNFIPRMTLEYLNGEIDDKPIKRVIESFIENNRVGYGIHWTCSMEVSIRAINILLVLIVLDGSERHFFSEMQRNKIIKFLYDSTIYIYMNLENKEAIPGNHYLSNLMALVTICPLFSSDVQRSIYEFAYKSIKKEIRNQFLDDGFNFESSTYYHLLSSEIAVIALSSIWHELEDEECEFFSCLMRRAHNAIESITTPDGTIIQVGDTDSGKVIDFHYGLNGNKESTKNNACLNSERVSSMLGFFIRGGVSSFESAFIATLCRKNINLVRDENSEKINPVGLGGLMNDTNKLCEENISFKFFKTHKFMYEDDFDIGDVSASLFEDFGLAVIKSEHFYCSISFTKTHNNGCHAHSDFFALNLYMNGQWYLRDPGTYSYTPSATLRNRYRGMTAHNGPLFKRGEQRCFDSLFESISLVNFECLSVKSDEIYVQGSIGDCIIRRTIRVTDDCFVVTDSSTDEIKYGKHIDYCEGYYAPTNRQYQLID